MKIDKLYLEIDKWLQSFPEFTKDSTLNINEQKIEEISMEFIERMKENYPFHHPLYAGQMLKPPHEVAIMAYLAAMLINPNNHALDGGPATAKMEKEVIEEFSKLFGFKTFLGHITTSGTIANFEALLISRELHPSKAVVFSSQAHYTHIRVCNWLKIPYFEINADKFGKMDLSKLEDLLQTQDVGTVVATLATTSLGALDDLKGLIELQNKYKFRIHIDAAYGGYFKIISNYNEKLKLFDLISYADSITFDPHKQGLQPYGAGCIIFADPSVGKFYKHDSPYTYFTTEELHLGEISVECSRAGAVAAAIWFTNKLFPLSDSIGFGPILKKTIDAATQFAELINNKHFRLYLNPETNIVTYFPIANSTTEISNLSNKIMKNGLNENLLWVATLKVKSSDFSQNHQNIIVDSEYTTILRSCFMKPEQKEWIPKIIEKLIYLREISD